MAATYVFHPPATEQAEVTSPKPSFFKTLFRRMSDSRQRQADAVVERHLKSSGGKFTDTTERDMERVLSGRTSVGFVR